MVTYISIYDNDTHTLLKNFETILVPLGHKLILCCSSAEECSAIDDKPWLKLKIKRTIYHNG